MLTEAPAVEEEIEPPAFAARRAIWVPPLAVEARTAAAMFSLSAKTWRRMDAAGDIPKGFHLYRRKVWRVADLERWAALGFPDRERFDAIQRGA